MAIKQNKDSVVTLDDSEKNKFNNDHKFTIQLMSTNQG